MGCIKALLEAGASPDIQNPVIGMASLHFAARKGHEGSVWALLEAGAGLDNRDPRGWAPLHYAATGGCEDCVRTLLEAGANTRVKNDDGNTPLDLLDLLDDCADDGVAIRSLLEP